MECLYPHPNRLPLDIRFGYFIAEADGGKRNALDSHPEHIREIAEASLKRPRIDAGDLFYQHCDTLNVPIDDIAELVNASSKRICFYRCRCFCSCCGFYPCSAFIVTFHLYG